MSYTAKSPPHSIGELPPGTRLGEFEIRRLLGVGGFGMVYLAFDHALEREVAIKEYMPASMAGRTETLHVSLRTQNDAEVFALGLRSFVNEARLLARFDHPSLLKVHRFWEANNTAYMAMPVLRGPTLRDIRKSGQATIDEAWLRRALTPLLGALEVLHAEGVYHRDIAPDNIQIEPDGRPVLLDFGAARRVIGDKTQSLTAILKPAYAPIEQYGESGSVKQGPWTDLYALGGTLHFMLLGQAPAPATARALNNELAGLAEQALPGCSPTFLAIIDWMLEPRPADRPQSVAELRAVLDGRSPLPVRPDPLSGRPGASGTDFDPDATVVRSPTVALMPADQAGATVPAGAAGPASSPESCRRSPPVPRTPTATAVPQRSKHNVLAVGGVVLAMLAGAAFWALRSPAPQTAAQPPAELSPVAAPAAPAQTTATADTAPAAAVAPGASTAPSAATNAAVGPSTAPASPAPIGAPTAVSAVPATATATPTPAALPLPPVAATPAAPLSAQPTTSTAAQTAAQGAAQTNKPAPAAAVTPPPVRPPVARPNNPAPPPLATSTSTSTAPAPTYSNTPLDNPASVQRPAPSVSSAAPSAPAATPGPAHGSATTPPAEPPAAAAPTLTPEGRCAGKGGLSRFVCMEDECLRSRAKNHPECVAWRNQSRPAHAQP
jgi:serine/threonine protein kinase